MKFSTFLIVASLLVFYASPSFACPYLSARYSAVAARLPAAHPPVAGLRYEDDLPEIGPNCTQLAHNDWMPPGSSRCPEDSFPPQFSSLMRNYSSPSEIPQHVWAPAYSMNWEFFFIQDFNELPPFSPPTPPNYSRMTKGRTWYAAEFIDENGQKQPGAMREQYLESCIAIFAQGPLHTNNTYSCDFVILNEVELGYLILHDDRPQGAPECCLIGRPFHAPPQTFFSKLYINKYSIQTAEKDLVVDWGGLTLPGAGLFAYGFQRDYYPGTNYSVPYAFYFAGIPDLSATWQYQVFSNFNPDYQPDRNDFAIPDSCATAVVCPGWG